jgi:hypothetical protein
MSLFEKEIANVQNPAYGAILAYYLAKGYSDAHIERRSIPLPIVFVGLPLLLAPEIVEVISHTTRGVRAVVEKINSGSKTGSDLLMTLLPRAQNTREFTLTCIKFLLRTNLASLDIASGGLIVHDDSSLARRPELPPETKEASKLGRWLSELSTFEISSLTKVVL